MTDATEQIRYLHTLSQISRSCLDELKEETKKLKEENGNQKQIIEIQQNLKKESEARQARDDTRSYLHGLMSMSIFRCTFLQRMVKGHLCLR